MHGNIYRTLILLLFGVINSKITYDVIIEAINNKRSGLNENAEKEEIATYITAYWTGGSSNGQIQYQYHYHSGSCYYICNGEQTIKSNSDNYSYTIRCTKCGASRTTNNGTHPGLCTKKFYTCGKNDGQIIGATIVY